MKARLLKWGNSLGIRLNKKEIERAGYKEKEIIDFSLNKKYSTAGDLWKLGSKHKLKGKVDTAKILLKIDKMFGEK